MLTDLRIRNIQLPTERKEAVEPDGKQSNLYLRTRHKRDGLVHTWIIVLKRQGKRRVYTVGNWPDVPIVKARAEAANKVLLEHGAAHVTVATAIEEFMESKIRPRYRRVRSVETYCSDIKAALGSLALDGGVRPSDVSRMVMEKKRTAPVAAMRLYSFAKLFFSWCVQIGYANSSPCADLRPSAFGVVEESRERVLTDGEIREFWNADDYMHVPLLRFLLLTGLRLEEARIARVKDIDRDNWLHIPAAHSKNKKAHKVYLPPLALAQIKKTAAPYLFRHVGQSAMQRGLRNWHDRREWDDAYYAQCKAQGVNPERWRAHDLRRSFATRCGNIGVQYHVVSKCLNHTLPGVGALPVYMRAELLDERKQAAEALAKHVAAVLAR